MSSRDYESLHTNEFDASSSVNTSESGALLDSRHSLDDDAVDIVDVDYLATQHKEGASVGASTINLLNTVVGGGTLGLPIAFSYAGYSLGVVLMVIFASFSVIGLNLLQICAREIDPKRSSFFQVAQQATPRFAFLIDVAIAVKCFGVATSYLVAIADMMTGFVDYVNPDIADGNLFATRYLWVFVFAICFVAPMAFKKDLKALTKASSVCLALMFYTVLLIVLYALFPTLGACDADMYDEACPGPTKMFAISKNTLRYLSVFVFSFTCHQNIFFVCNEIENNTRERVTKVTIGTIGTALIVYLCVAVLGYHTFGSLINSDIVTNYKTTFPFAILKLALSVNLGFSYALQSHPARESVCSLLVWFGLKTKEDVLNSSGPFQIKNVITCIMIMCSVGIALVVDDLGVVLSSVGASGSTIITYILPGLVYVQMFPEPHLLRYVAYVQLIMGLIIMPSCLTFIFVLGGGE